MNKRIFIPFLLILSFSSHSQDEYVNEKVLKYDDVTYNSNIKTVVLGQNTWEYAAPIIHLNSPEQLQLIFDDLDSDVKQYSISFVHCNADWTPSNLKIGEYLDGFYEMNVLTYSFSMSTMQKFTHYAITFPNQGNQQNTKFTKSGNYLLYMYLNGDKNDLVLCRRFMVIDDKTIISATLRQGLGDANQYSKQRLDFSINSGSYDINNAYRDMKVVLVQNFRWDNAVYNIQPTFLNGNTFTYNMDDASTFNGGNEFRYFDMRSLRFLTERVKDIYRDKDYKAHVILQNDESRATKAYSFYNDINGGYLIKNREGFGNEDIESDYVTVHFFLPYNKPESNGNFYVMGKLTDWRMNTNSKMTYNDIKLGYEKTLYLKQGYYNYNYVLSNDDKKGGDESYVEGTHWETENDYNIYVYHRKFGTTFDQLIGMKKFNSLKK